MVADKNNNHNKTTTTTKLQLQQNNNYKKQLQKNNYKKQLQNNNKISAHTETICHNELHSMKLYVMQVHLKTNVRRYIFEQYHAQAADHKMAIAVFFSC